MSKQTFKTKLLARGVILGAPFDGGGQASVFRATNLDGDPLAVKRLSNMKRVDRFVREIETMRSLADNGCAVVPPIIDHIVDAVDAAFWMPLYPDGSLQRRLNNDSIDEPLVLVRRLVDALQELHRFEVSHRDIKPDNILFDGDRVLLADLGLHLDPADQENRLTGTFEQIGPRFYMAPEMADGPNPSGDHRPADLYSMSKVIWCVLRRRPFPFDREEPHWTTGNLPSTVMKEPAWKPIEERIRNWMSKDPTMRTVTFDEVLGSIELSERAVETRKSFVPTDDSAVDLSVHNTLQILSAEYKAEKERAAEAHRVTDMALTEERINSVEAWYQRTLRPKVIETATTSRAFDVYSAYADAAGEFMQLGGLPMGGHPISPVPAAIDRARLPQSTAVPGPEIPGAAERPHWYMHEYLYDITVRFPHVHRRFALVAVVGTIELRFETCQLENMAGTWMRVPSDVADFEYLPVMFEPTVERAGNLAISVVKAVAAFIEAAVSAETPSN